MLQETKDKLIQYLLKHESQLDSELQEIFQDLLNRKPQTRKPVVIKHPSTPPQTRCKPPYATKDPDRHNPPFITD